MPATYFALLLATVLLAAGLTIALAIGAAGTGTAALAALALVALLARLALSVRRG